LRIIQAERQDVLRRITQEKVAHTLSSPLRVSTQQSDQDQGSTSSIVEQVEQHTRPE
jgi:hypothetical protein